MNIEGGGESAADRHRRIKAEQAGSSDDTSSEAGQESLSAWDQHVGSESVATDEGRTPAKLQRQKVWTPRAVDSNPEQIPEITQAERLAELNNELDVIKAELVDLQIENIEQYVAVVAILVEEHGLTPQDAMTLVINQSSTMSSVDKHRAIKQVEKKYTRSVPEKSAGFFKRR